MAFRNFFSIRTLMLTTVGLAFLFIGCADKSTPEQAIEPEATLEDTPELSTDVDGKAMFVDNCGGCHGASGTVADADPEMLELLDARPPDLTKLTMENGGTFPTSFVTETVDGRQRLKAHGTGDMPIWGEIWSQKEGVMLSGKKVAALVAYIESIQQ